MTAKRAPRATDTGGQPAADADTHEPWAEYGRRGAERRWQKRIRRLDLELGPAHWAYLVEQARRSGCTEAEAAVHLIECGARVLGVELDPQPSSPEAAE